ncbi:hypothetical protein Ava_2546 [Trichormus variabilis ATCC 29413]|uniref:PIN domain-containing protein n=2 Tax=Anabaena variabilis TaxID=264691 RepID=Q3MA25_TRIV2|nr:MULTISPECIES: hypothetical protein [Nostocaceae]ABA22161.1 hypothetical protein Ava_2546 [Trichormus variabilis ATCC 29413]MBC1214917.1 hypothetical protein [Trichormus variabilis ARAD]MBC1256887.1 hypothetical protein [Trichormus variabilis V5]MBC1269872.1 hypothetical protein [Trichormus variabilis FSR]MBC1302458.1 hypothetical protein [Trichormus variabilis N2B]
MRKVLLIDTSLLCVWLKVPGKETAGNNKWNFELVNQKIQEESAKSTTLVLPLATIIETGNHIAQAKTNDSAAKLITARQFANIITYAADETSPWAAFREQIVLWEADELKKLAEQFPNQAVEKTSMGDASIVLLGWHYHQKGYHVEFLTDDDKLKSQEPPPPSPPTRRSSRR